MKIKYTEDKMVPIIRETTDYSLFKNYIKHIWYSYCDSWLRAIRKNVLQKSCTKKEGSVVNAKRFPLSRSMKYV